MQMQVYVYLLYGAGLAQGVGSIVLYRFHYIL